MAKPRQEFLGTITKLAAIEIGDQWQPDGIGIVDGYGSEIRNITSIVLNNLTTHPTTGPSKGAFWVYNDLPYFTDSGGIDYNLLDGGGGSANVGSGSVTLVAGYGLVETTIPSGSQIFWSVDTAGGVPGSISVENQSTLGFELLSTSSYDTSTLNWLWVNSSNIIPLSSRALTSDFLQYSSIDTTPEIVNNISTDVPKIGQALVTVSESESKWISVVTSDSIAQTYQLLWNNGNENVWTSNPIIGSISAVNGVSVGPGNFLGFDSLPATIGFTKLAGSNGKNLSISAQHSKLLGGNLNLSSGSGQSSGIVNIQIGGTNAIVIGSEYLRNNGSFQYLELNNMSNDVTETHVVQGYDGRTAAHLMKDYGLYTVIPKAYQQSTEYAPRRDKQFGGFGITKEGAGEKAAEQVLTFSSTILGSKIPACRKIIGTFLIGYSRTGGAGSSSLYLLDAYSDESGNLKVCSLTTTIEQHNGNESYVRAIGSISSDSTFDITVIRPDTASAFEVVSYYWELNYGWA